MRLALALLVVPALAHAEPRIEVLDRGEYVEVIGHEIKSTRTNLNVARQRIEIPLASLPNAMRAQPKDPTVIVAEIDPDSRAFSVKLNLDHNSVVALAKVSQAQQIGEDLHLIVPRKVPAEGANVTLPEPTLPVVEAPKPIAPPVVDTAKKPEAPKVEAPKAEAKPAPKTDDKPVAAAGATETKTDPPKLGGASDGNSPTNMLLGAGLLAAAAGIFWLNKKRKKGATAPIQAIDVIAQKSLGGRARIVWLGAGQRELIIAVTPQNIRLLGEWPRGEGPSTAAPAPIPNLPRARTENLSPRTSTRNLAAAAAAAIATVDDNKPAVSPAINGILRLRNRHVEPLADDLASGSSDEDATWARELLAATGAKR